MDGSDEHVEIPYNSSLALANEFTFSVWCYPTSTGGGQRMIDRGTAYYLGWDYENNQFNFTVNRSGGNDHLYASSTSSLNTWYHVVGVHTGGGGSGTMDLYVDGSVAGTQLTSLINATVDTNSFIIGGHASGAYFSGNIDETAIWNKALSADEISAIYGTKMTDLSVDAGDYESSANLIGWWRFGDGVLDDRIKGGLVADQVNPTIGSELTTNGDVETWDNSTTLTGWTSEGGALRVSGARTSGSGTYYADFTDDSSGGDRFITPAFATVSGTVYKLTFWYKNTTSSTDVSIYASAFLLGYTTLTNTSGVWTQGVYYFAGNGNAALIRFRTGALDATISIDDVSVKQITGNAGIAINSEAADFEADVPA